MHCKQTVPGKTEDLRKHAANCNNSSNQDKLAARYQQIKAGEAEIPAARFLLPAEKTATCFIHDNTLAVDTEVWSQKVL